MTRAFDEIAETFAFLDDWEDRYRHLIELGKALPPLPAELKVPATKVSGCASQVWLVPDVAGSGPAARFDFRGDSDALIVRGLIAVLHALYAGRPVREAAALDPAPELARLGLDSHLSAQRSNGLRAMVARLREAARSAAAAA